MADNFDGFAAEESVSQARRLIERFDWRDLGQYRDEAISQATLAFWEALVRGKGKNYAYGCAYNRVTKVIRDSARVNRAHVFLDSLYPDQSELLLRDREDETRDKLIRQSIGLALRKLPRLALACLGLQVIRGYKPPKIASSLGLDETTVRRILNGAKEKVLRDVRAALPNE